MAHSACETTRGGNNSREFTLLTLLLPKMLFCSREPGSRHGMISSRWATGFIFSLHFPDSSKPTTQIPASSNRLRGKFRPQGAHLCSGKAFCAVKYSADSMSKREESSAKRQECLRPKHVFTLFQSIRGTE